MSKYYGVSQLNHGHEYRWIFEKEELEEWIEQFPENETVDVDFPFGGSNSSATLFEPLETNEEIKEFLWRKAEGPDLDDPMLIDIAEYYLTVDTGFGSCTQKFLDKFKLEEEDLVQTDDMYSHMYKSQKMLEELIKSNKYNSIIDKEPYYGFSSNLRYSELCDLYYDYKSTYKKYEATINIDFINDETHYTLTYNIHEENFLDLKRKINIEQILLDITSDKQLSSGTFNIDIVFQQNQKFYDFVEYVFLWNKDLNKLIEKERELEDIMKD